jgi:hypothetical protein
MHKTFSANGKVDRNRHFFVDPSKWNEKKLIPLLKNNTYPCLMAPSQSGKTTRIMVLLEMLNKEKDILAISIDMGSLFPTSSSFLDSFTRELENQVRITLSNEIIRITEGNLCNIFHRDNKERYFGGRNVVLIIDEIDLLSKVDNEERNIFLVALHTLKQANTPNQTSSLLAALVITNAVGAYLIDSLGNSPFNVAEPVFADYFTELEVEDLFAQYAKQENIELDEGIVKAVYKNTTGAQGLTVMYGGALHIFKKEVGHPPNNNEWNNYIYSPGFFNKIMLNPNYLKMVRAIKGTPNCMQQLFHFYKNKSVDNIGIATIDRLIQANVLIADPFNLCRFASPFVENLVKSLYRKEEYPIYTPKMNQQQQVDFVDLICAAIQNIDPTELLFGQKMVSNMACSKCPVGWKEEVYRSALSVALSNILDNNVSFT